MERSGSRELPNLGSVCTNDCRNFVQLERLHIGYVPERAIGQEGKRCSEVSGEYEPKRIHR
jgi:hypothetical protein